MDWAAIMGALSLGMVMGWLVRYFVGEMEKFTAKAFGTMTSVLVGAAVLGFFQYLSAGSQSGLREVYFYPVGLLIGILITSRNY